MEETTTYDYVTTTEGTEDEVVINDEVTTDGWDDYTYSNDNAVVETSDDIEFNLDDFTGGLLVGGMLFTLLAVVGVILLIKVISRWIINNKAGKPGWAAIIPFYSEWVAYDMVNMPGWLCFASFIPFIGSIAVLIFEIIQCIRLAKVFGKPTEFCIGLILLPIVFYPILAFGKAEYQGKEAAGGKLFG